MGSGLIYAAIVAIWGLLLVPMWMRKHETDQKISEVDNFTQAMKTLADPVIPEPRNKPTVIVKREVRAGLADPDKKRRMQLRRRAFSAVVASIPVSVVGVFFVDLSHLFLLTPLAAFSLYVAWVRSDVRRRAELKNPRTARKTVRETQQIAAPVEAEKVERGPRKVSQLAASFAAIRRNAAQRLLETEPEVDTAATESWQPAVSTSWSQPETPLPTYVSAPAATVVPREIDRKYGGEWNGETMLEAAAAQRQNALAAFVSDVMASEKLAAAEDTNPTTELPRIATA
ncbi:MAG: hypothetical protein RIS43_493 [Actinomycetota bacterium]